MNKVEKRSKGKNDIAKLTFEGSISPQGFIMQTVLFPFDTSIPTLIMINPSF